MDQKHLLSLVTLKMRTKPTVSKMQMTMIKLENLVQISHLQYHVHQRYFGKDQSGQKVQDSNQGQLKFWPIALSWTQTLSILPYGFCCQHNRIHMEGFVCALQEIRKTYGSSHLTCAKYGDKQIDINSLLTKLKDSLCLAGKFNQSKAS